MNKKEHLEIDPLILYKKILNIKDKLEKDNEILEDYYIVEICNDKNYVDLESRVPLSEETYWENSEKIDFINELLSD